ncbi:8-oxoguanine DNA glycosylase OGG fold protein [Streptomyces nigra]
MNEQDGQSKQDGQNRQYRADAVDREMAVRLLPGPVVRALGRWWETNAAAYADGTPGAHTIRYTPGRWAHITAWPKTLAPTSASGDAALSRAQVASTVTDALRQEAFREALVATYVWGKGKRGTPGGSGPSALHKILAFDGLDAALAAAITTLREHGAPQAYAALQGQVPGLGPAFFTKFLYFTGMAVPPARGPQPLILDRVLSRRMRQLAAAVGRASGHDVDGSIAAWVWSDGNWSPHRYQVYLSFMHAAADQLAAEDSWPSDAAPDLLECALFTTAWETSD